jgi:hypothetical protein
MWLENDWSGGCVYINYHELRGTFNGMHTSQIVNMPYNLSEIM